MDANEIDMWGVLRQTPTLKNKPTNCSATVNLYRAPLLIIGAAFSWPCPPQFWSISLERVYHTRNRCTAPNSPLIHQHSNQIPIRSSQRNKHCTNTLTFHSKFYHDVTTKTQHRYTRTWCSFTLFANYLSKDNVGDAFSNLTTESNMKRVISQVSCSLLVQQIACGLHQLVGTTVNLRSSWVTSHQIVEYQKIYLTQHFPHNHKPQSRGHDARKYHIETHPTISNMVSTLVDIHEDLWINHSGQWLRG